MSSPRVLEVPVPNLVPTLKLKQAKRQDYMEENAELEFSFRRPQSESASALALGTMDFASTGRSVKSRGKIVKKDDLYNSLMKKKKRRNKKKSSKKAKASAYKAGVKTEVASPKITRNLFFISLNKKIYPDRRLKKIKKEKKVPKDVDVYAPRIKQKLPILSFEQAGIIGQRMFKELLSDVEEIKKHVQIMNLQQKQKQEQQLQRKTQNNNNDIDTIKIDKNNNNNIKKKEDVNNNNVMMKKKKSTDNSNNKIQHSSKIHQIFCSFCLAEFENMQKYRLHQKYSCKERLVKCYNPGCHENVSISRMDYHITYECRWMKYTDVVINESNEENATWPKVKMRNLKRDGT